MKIIKIKQKIKKMNNKIIKYKIYKYKNNKYKMVFNIYLQIIKWIQISK